MTDSGHKIYFPFMTGTYVIRLPYFPAAVNLLASFIFQLNYLKRSSRVKIIRILFPKADRN